MRAHVFSTLLTLATIGLAGCALETTETTDPTDTEQSAMTIAERHFVDVTSDDRGIGGRSGITVAGDHERRMYDVDKTPRVGQRNPYEVNLVVLRNALVVPHGGTLGGNEIRRHPETDCGVTCTAP